MATVPNYEIKRIIGSGSFGYVFEAYDHSKKRKVALKRIQKVGNKLSREYEILLDIKESDYVVKILDFYYSKTEQGKLIQNIVFEYMEDNLESLIGQYIKNKRFFPEKQIKVATYFLLFRAISFRSYKDFSLFILKEQHTGISSRNIFFQSLRENVLLLNDKVKICDFGSSKEINKEGKNTPYIVSRYYRCPELILCITNYTTAIDVWAVGSILAELILREPIFQGKTEGDQLFAIFKIIGSMSQEEINQFKCRVPYDPKIFDEFQIYKGVNLKEKFQNFKDLDNLIDLLKKMFAYLPERRITASEALKHPFFQELQQQ